MNANFVSDSEIERTLAQIERQSKLQAKVLELIEHVNGGSERELANAIVSALNRSHRTLQQSFMGAVKLAVRDYSLADSDLRNEEAVRWAGKVAELENSDLRFPHF